MARTRLELHSKLKDILGSNNVYFRQPAKGMKYPCFIYDLDGDYTLFADNVPYINPKRWSITIVEENPDSELPEKLKILPYCRFDRVYQADCLNHFVFTLYF